MDRFSNVVLSAAIVVGAGACEATRVCYAHSSAEVDQAITSGECGDVYVYDVTEEVMRFTNDEPLVYVVIASANNPAVRRVEAAGLGNVNTSGIDEVIRTNTSCAGAAAAARILELAIGPASDSGPGFCEFAPEAGSIVRISAEPGSTVGSMVAYADWPQVTIEIDESAQPTEKLTTSVAPLEVLQKFGSRMKDVLLFVSDEDVLADYSSWLDSEGYTGTVHVNSDDGSQTPVQVYPPVSE